MNTNVTIYLASRLDDKLIGLLSLGQCPKARIELLLPCGGNDVLEGTITLEGTF